MRRRININIDDDISDRHALLSVLDVIDAGRIRSGGKQYCFVTPSLNVVIVYAYRTRAGNDSFTVGEDPSYKGEAE